jgi:CheY-like chemotaxis protein
MVALMPAGYENGDLSGGSVRTFRLPRPLTRRGVAGVLREFNGGAASSEIPEGDEVADTVAPTLDGLHVLLVEDRAENRDFLTRVLEGAGCEVDTASDGEIGLLQFKTSGCDLVLTDLDMPAMDGFRLLEEIRRTEADEGRSKTPVVAITAHTDDATAERCFKAGMDAYVTKPVSRYEILRIVRDLAHPDPMILVVEDDPKSLELSCQILQQRGFRTVGAGTGEEAIRRVVRNGVDAVLLDMTLPDFSGLEVVQRIRTIPKAKDLPVIGVTGHAGADQAQRCKEAGCTGFVEKPVKWDLLVEILQGLLDDSNEAVFTPLVEGLARLEASQASYKSVKQGKGDSEEPGPRARAVGE